MKDDDDPSYSEELDNLESWDHSFWLSRAFMEAALTLSDAMLEGELSSQYSSSRVVLHVARQGLELFLKAALEVIGLPTMPHGHNIDRLFTAYRQAYPGAEFHFHTPWQMNYRPPRDYARRWRFLTSSSAASFAAWPRTMSDMLSVSVGQTLLPGSGRTGPTLTWPRTRAFFFGFFAGTPSSSAWPATSATPRPKR